MICIVCRSVLDSGDQSPGRTSFPTRPPLLSGKNKRSQLESTSLEGENLLGILESMASVGCGAPKVISLSFIERGKGQMSVEKKPCPKP